MTIPTSRRRAAILIVHGGGNRETATRWTRLCLDRIAAFTDYPDYHIYLWNNYPDDRALEEWFAAQPSLTLLSAASYEILNHPHRTPLQRLYHLARDAGAHYIVTMDNDAHPLRAGWLTPLLAALDDGAALAGVWRDEMAATFSPYVHPSCLCTTVGFVEEHHLRFDFDTVHVRKGTDTLTSFTRVAEAEGAPIYRLARSNRRNFHYLMGGIYGDSIYHHGAAGRDPIFHRDIGDRTSAAARARWQRERADIAARNGWQNEQAARLIFGAYDAYIGWLRGEDVPHPTAARLDALAAGAPAGAWGSRLRGWRQLLRRQLHKLPAVARLAQAVRAIRKAPAQRVQERSALKDGPFTVKDLAPLPHGWTVQPPDFVGIGAPHSGAEWWQALIADHPQVTPDRVMRAEAHGHQALEYFVHFQPHNLTAAQMACYRQAFAVPPGAICGKFSTLYLGQPGSIEQLAATAPTTRILVILRNPIDRFMAHLRQLTGVADGQSLSLPAQAGSPLYATAAQHTLYGASLERLLCHFDRDQVLILQYERMVQEPAQALARTYRFLGVDDRYRPRALAEPRPADVSAAGALTACERAQLAADFAADVRRLLRICPELEADLWPDFTP
jgi:hypothetical protein